MALAPRARSEEATWEYAVQLSATIQEFPPRMELNWSQDTLGIPDRYTVHRKPVDADAWGEGVVLPGTTTRFIDTHVAVATAYEYQVVKSAPGYTGYGYLCAGIRVPFIDRRGKVILVVDRTHTADLTDELGRLQQDLTGDGWAVVRREVGRDDPQDLVRSIIRTEYQADPGNVEAVFLFGHVPVPHSGNYDVDGHGSRPMPADAFYGDMEGDWQLALLSFQRAGETDADLTVFYELSGTATKWEDYRRYEGDMPLSITIPTGASFAILALYAVENDEVEGGESIRLTLREDPAYRVGTSNTVELTITDSSVVPPDPIVSVVATDPAGSGAGSDPGVFTFSRTGDPNETLTVHYTLGGTATRWEDYRRWEGDMPDSISLPAGEHSADLTLHVVPDATRETIRQVVLTLKAGAGHQLGTPREASITLLPEPARITGVTTDDEGHVRLSWTSVAGAIYEVAFKPDLADPDWIDLSGPISASSSATSWQDTSPPASTHRHYIVRLVAFE